MLLRTVFFIFALSIVPGLATASARMALVIGNSSYGEFADLKNPGVDANDIASALASLGYQVTRHLDADKDAMEKALRDFRNEAVGASHAIIYFAGHGIEIDRQNYLIPTDAMLKSDLDVEFEAIPLGLVERAVQGAKQLQLVILDACRDNPFLNTMTRSTGRSRSIGRGLGDIEPTGSSLIFYAARHGTVAFDGAGRNSPFAAALLEAFEEPNLEIGQLVRRVRDEVLEATRMKQEPFVYGTLSSRQVFIHQADVEVAGLDNPETTVPATSLKQSISPAFEIAIWEAVERGGTEADYLDYLDRFPQGQFRSLAERRLVALKQKQQNGSEERIPAPDTTQDVAKPDAQPVGGLQALASLPEPGDTPVDAETMVHNDSAPPLPQIDDTPLEVTPDIVREVQERLNAGGFDAGPVDGLAGNRTNRAVVAFSDAFELETDGAIDKIFITALRREVSDDKVAAWKEAQPKQDRPKRSVQKSTQTKQSTKLFQLKRSTDKRRYNTEANETGPW